MHPPPIPAETATYLAAGLWPRTAAWLLDALIVGLPAFVVLGWFGDGHGDALAAQWRGLGTVVGDALRQSLSQGDTPSAMVHAWMSPDGPLRLAIAAFVSNLYAAVWPAVAIFALIALMYWPLQEAGPHGATFGKRAVGVRTTDAAGANVDMRRAFLRHVAGSLSWVTLNVGHLIAARAPNHLALHDRIAHTRVQWRKDAAQKVPAWGWLFVVIACVAPLVFAAWAVFSLSAAMQTAIGL